MKARYLTLLLSLLAASAQAQLWTDPKDPKLGPDFKIQGEYAGSTASGKKLGVQIIGLGGGSFQAVLYPGGLPGAGWDGKNKSLLAGKMTDPGATFEEAAGNRKYLGNSPEQFSATSKFPPEGHKPASMKVTPAKLGSKASGKFEDGEEFTLERIVRKSDSMGAKPPKGALVLFDGSGKEEWKGGRVDEKTKLLNTDGKDILTAKKFNNYTMHLEFMLPYKPGARGQGRGNSGFYHVDHYEMQILDSFGLEGLNNECGGIYQKADSKVNACFPPLQWQTYDVEFTNSVAKDGKKVKNARLTAKLNGIVIHDDLEIDGKTGGARGEPEGTPGSIKLQGHGNPLQFRNAWIVEKK